jgi:hypothetical protein
VGASHQTGWTGAIAFLIDFFGRFDAPTWLDSDPKQLHARMVREQVGGERRQEVEEVLAPVE